ncbi:hypothetical protein [Stratiformator vulcanicus]|uniref:Carboxypeptidase regulatory-like domain-containing protein n=1 Tax=Stratiformator vulcanicus TaxID=2527980 RepID=A0A517R1A0_9PLAN|nr:hypothetical protein [Stratiformator vulcanicus]QDT37623.1 hypothetical protein Pan189_20030 [Stratiformator vulcanicus]
MTKSISRHYSTAWLAIFAACLLGCGSESGVPGQTVSGHVSVNGKPINDGKIWFLPQEIREDSLSRVAWSQIDDGTYSIKSEEGPAPGEHVVRIEAYDRSNESKEVFDEDTGETVEQVVEVVDQLLPPEFNSRSGLSATIAEGNNEVDFELDP